MVVSPTVLTASKPAVIRAARATATGSAARRRIPPQAGRALEVLGHAIGYLTDEYILHGGKFRATDPELTAVQLLISANRAIYFECPAVPTFGERCLRLFGIGHK